MISGKLRHVLDIGRYIRLIHIYSSIPVLLLMVFFAVTGFYLNHPEFEPGGVTRSQHQFILPGWAIQDQRENKESALNALKLLDWLDKKHNIHGVDFSVEREDVDNVLLFDLSGPNGSAVIEIAFDQGFAFVDQRELSVLASLNNLHRAKHVTGLWRYLSDFSALCMLVFCLSGAWLIAINRLQRRNTSIAFILGSGLFFFVIVFMH